MTVGASVVNTGDVNVQGFDIEQQCLKCHIDQHNEAQKELCGQIVISGIFSLVHATTDGANPESDNNQLSNNNNSS